MSARACVCAYVCVYVCMCACVHMLLLHMQTESQMDLKLKSASQVDLKFQSKWIRNTDWPQFRNVREACKPSCGLLSAVLFEIFLAFLLPKRAQQTGAAEQHFW